MGQAGAALPRGHPGKMFRHPGGRTAPPGVGRAQTSFQRINHAEGGKEGWLRGNGPNLSQGPGSPSAVDRSG